MLLSKNPDLLLDAVEILLDERPDLRVTFVGDGELFQRIKRRGKSILVRISPWPDLCTIQTAVADYMARATVVAVPDEGGLTMPHALAHGVPVVANNDPIRNNPEYEVLSPGGKQRDLHTWRRQLVRECLEISSVGQRARVEPLANRRQGPRVPRPEEVRPEDR